MTHLHRTSPGYVLEFEINDLPKTTNAQAGMHWRKKGEYVKAWHHRVWASVGARKPAEPLLRAKLTLTRFSSIEPDFDGLVSSFKAVIDGLIKCGVLADDKMSNIGQSDYLWVKAAPKNGKITVKVEQI